MAILPRDVTKSINSQLPREIGKQVEAMVTKQFQIVKLEMLKSFDSHPVTVEIENGSNSTNTSRTLGGYGNLFSFIGFIEGSDPLGPVRQRLKSTTIRKTSQKNGVFDFITNEPSREELFSMTKISSFRTEFEGGRSWLDGIETGLSGLGFYLYNQKKNFDSSRSGNAIQIRGGKKSEKAFGGGSTGGAIGMQRSRYKRVSYISGILKDFAKSVERLRSLTLS
jgi:hypothetical protein